MNDNFVGRPGRVEKSNELDIDYPTPYLLLHRYRLLTILQTLSRKTLEGNFINENVHES
jgi:hypothetical protein